MLFVCSHLVFLYEWRDWNTPREGHGGRGCSEDQGVCLAPLFLYCVILAYVTVDKSDKNLLFLDLPSPLRGRRDRRAATCLSLCFTVIFIGG